MRCTVTINETIISNFSFGDRHCHTFIPYHIISYHHDMIDMDMIAVVSHCSTFIYFSLFIISILINLCLISTFSSKKYIIQWPLRSAVPFYLYLYLASAIPLANLSRTFEHSFIHSSYFIRRNRYHIISMFLICHFLLLRHASRVLCSMYVNELPFIV